MGYTIKDKPTALTLVRAGKEKPWDDKHGSSKIGEPVGIFMRTQLAKLDETATERDTEGELTVTEAKKQRVRWDETEGSEELTPFFETTTETTDGVNIEQTPLHADTPVCTTTDVYNTRLIFAIPPSEVFGKLKTNWTAGSAATITLDSGFSVFGETEIQVNAAPVVTEQTLSANTPVTCRFIKAIGEWRFFRPTGGEKTAIFTASGNALAGFGTHDGRETWATQLSAASDNVNAYLTVAVGRNQPAVASQDETPWLEFPTDMDGATEPSYVRGDKYIENGRIYNKTDFGTVYQKSGQDYRPTFQTFNQRDCWRKAGNLIFLYYDGFGKWMEGNLGVIHTDPPAENPGATGGIYGADTIAELGFTIKSKPYWDCATTYGVYQPQNGASGTLTFGLPTWQVTDDDGTQTFSRSWKQTNSHWIYEGAVTVEETEYRNITYNPASGTEYPSAAWCLGNRKDAENGWYESATELATDAAKTFTFTVVPKDDKEATAAAILKGWEAQNGMIIYDEDSDEYWIEFKPVSWWHYDASEAQGVSFLFEFQAPDGADVTQEDKTVELAEILDHTWNQSNVSYDAQMEKFIIGTHGDPEGWWEADETDLSTAVVFEYKSIERDDLTFNFSTFVKGSNTEPIWFITPEIIT